LAHRIESCIGNRSFGTDDILDRAQAEFRDVQVREWGCLGNCHRCFRAPFVLIDDLHLIEAPDADTLWQRLCETLPQRSPEAGGTGARNENREGTSVAGEPDCDGRL